MSHPDLPAIRVWATSHRAMTNLRRLCALLSDRFAFVETQDAPDFVFCMNMERSVLRYPGVRIQIIGENILPDFNLVDYAIGFDRLSLGDRYLRWPLLRAWKSYASLHSRMPYDEIVRDRDKFCACVVSNVTNRQGALDAYIDCFSAYRPVQCGGRWRNNVGGRVADKLAFLRQHKFSFAFENTSYPGYATEKITDAFAAGTIPIYWGDPDITRDINPDAFVMCHDFDSPEAVLSRVKQIDGDEDLYRSMLTAPVFRNGKEPDEYNESRLVAFLYNIFSQPLPAAYRRPRGRWGQKYEWHMKSAFFWPPLQAVYLAKQGLETMSKWIKAS